MPTIVSPTGKPAHQDPTQAAFWDQRFSEGVTPWDAGATPAAMMPLIATLAASQRVLIPGCGSAYEVAAFAEAGHEVVAIDFSAQAVAAARATLGRYAALVRQADFFTTDLGAPFDIVYERAFLCALPRALWQRYAERMAELLKPGAQLAGFFFWNESPRGPPFGLAPGELEALLRDRFERVVDAPVADSLPVFAGKERWQVWRRSP